MKRDKRQQTTMNALADIVKAFNVSHPTKNTKKIKVIYAPEWCAMYDNVIVIIDMKKVIPNTMANRCIWCKEGLILKDGVLTKIRKTSHKRSGYKPIKRVNVTSCGGTRTQKKPSNSGSFRINPHLTGMSLNHKDYELNKPIREGLFIAI